MTEEKKVETTVIEAVEKGNLNLEQRIMGVMKDVIDAKIKALELALDTKIEEILKSKEIEMEQALRKGFGLDVDPVIHQSDLISAIRKAQLAEGDTGKRTPAPEALTKSTGPDGNLPENKFEKMVKDFEGGKQA